MRDVVLQYLVDQVDVWQNRVGVLAGQREFSEVGTAGVENVERGFGAGRQGVGGRVEEVQQVDQVGGRAEHRTAVIALAEVLATEQLLHRRERLYQRVPGGL